MVCLLTIDGKLRIYNSSNLDEVLQNAATFHPVESPDAISLENNGSCILPNQMVTFPGIVYNIAALQCELTILADQVYDNTVLSNEEQMQKGPYVYVLADTVQDLDAPIMKLCLMKV